MTLRKVYRLVAGQHLIKGIAAKGQRAANNG
jgi:hypothetical protein